MGYLTIPLMEVEEHLIDLVEDIIGNPYIAVDKKNVCRIAGFTSMCDLLKEENNVKVKFSDDHAFESEFGYIDYALTSTYGVTIVGSDTFYDILQNKCYTYDLMRNIIPTYLIDKKKFKEAIKDLPTKKIVEIDDISMQWYEDYVEWNHDYKIPIIEFAMKGEIIFPHLDYKVLTYV